MNRRGFLKRLLGAVAALPVARLLAKAAVSREVPSPSGGTIYSGPGTIYLRPLHVPPTAISTGLGMNFYYLEAAQRNGDRPFKNETGL
jgi:hypothetical protein